MEVLKQANLRPETSKTMLHMRMPCESTDCFKSKARKRECRFGFPRPTVEKSIIDEFGVTHLRRDSEWVTPYTCIAVAISSNQDLPFMGTKAKALALVYYITNYATKDEASTYQMVMAAALIRKILDEQDTSTLSAEEKHRLQTFPLHVVTNDREVSGVEVACSLLQLPAYYTPKTEVVRINL
jgi:hypothetical protein